MSVQVKVIQHSSSSWCCHDLKHFVRDPWGLFHAIFTNYFAASAITLSLNCVQLEQSFMARALKWFAITHAYVAAI